MGGAPGGGQARPPGGNPGAGGNPGTGNLFGPGVGDPLAKK